MRELLTDSRGVRWMLAASVERLAARMPDERNQVLFVAEGRWYLGITDSRRGIGGTAVTALSVSHEIIDGTEHAVLRADRRMLMRRHSVALHASDETCARTVAQLLIAVNEATRAGWFAPSKRRVCQLARRWATQSERLDRAAPRSFEHFLREHGNFEQVRPVAGGLPWIDAPLELTA